MAYLTGQAADAAALVTEILAFAGANGFTVSGSMASSAYSFTRVRVDSVNTSWVEVRGFGAADGSTEPGPALVYAKLPTTAWPVTYHLFAHANPTELFCVIKYATDKHTWLGFGELQKAYNYTGGNYYSAMYSSAMGIEKFYAGALTPAASSTFVWNTSPYGGASGLFMGGWTSPSATVGGTERQTGYFRCNYKGVAWPGQHRNPNAVDMVAHLLAKQPNQWNGQAVLLPMRATLWSTESSAWVDFGGIPHARYLRIDNYASGDIITLGTDRWMVFPGFRKNTVNRAITDYTDHTGTYGWAICYDGP